MRTSMISKVYTASLVRHYSTQEIKKWQSTVGLEVHAQILSNTKIFSSASSSFLSPVNTNVSLHDASIPGTLPVLNKRCVEAGVLTALALDCKLNMVSTFDRKHYFYGDMPAGYQITQQRNPLAVKGTLDFFVFTPGVHKVPYTKQVKIKQLQLEQDSGKSLHAETYSLVDLNRNGMGLMEIVLEPDLKDGEEAAALIKELLGILRRLGTCSCKMEEGAVRIDANVSINRPGEPLGTRTELKNIGSVRGVANAVKYEIDRQIKLKERGQEIINETRSWDPNSKATVPMRDKEEKQDYRYMPEPNLPPLFLSLDEEKYLGLVSVNKLRKLIPELPGQTRQRLENELGLAKNQAIVLVNDDVLYQFFENSLLITKVDPKLLANLLIYEFSSVINNMDVQPEEFLHRTKFVAETIHLLETKQINRNITKFLFGELFQNNPKEPLEIVTEQNLFQITDDEELTKLCKEVMSENDNLVKLYLNGKTKVFRSFMGKIYEKSNHRADMGKCAELLKKLLEN